MDSSEGRNSQQHQQQHQQQPSALIQRHRKSKWPALPFDEAFDVMDSYFDHFVNIEQIPVQQLQPGYVLAEDIVATKQYPEFRTSIKDGYAVIASDGTGPRTVIQKTTAGVLTAVTVTPKCCCRVNTGSMVPDGADAVVPVEDTVITKHDNVEELEINVLNAPNKGSDIRTVGCDVSIGTVMLKRHTVLNAAEIGIIMLSEQKIISVYRQPKIAVMSTGNELVDGLANGCPMGFVRDTNRPQIIALLQQNGFNSIDMGIVPDSEDKLLECLSNAFSVSNIVVTSGGVSMGEKDLLKETLEHRFKFKIQFGRVFLKPGLPTTFATGIYNGEKKAIFALPGNPVSTYVTANLFVLPAVKKCVGITNYRWTTLKAKTMDDLKLEGRPEFRPAKLYVSDDGCLTVTSTVESQLSSRLLAAQNSNALIRLPKKSDACSMISSGSFVDILITGQV